MEENKVPKFNKEDMERKFYNAPPRWATILAVIVFVLLMAALLFPFFAQRKT